MNDNKQTKQSTQYIESAKAQLKRELDQRIKSLGRLELLTPILTDLNLEFELYSTVLDFNYLKHGDVVRVMLAFPGKWDKSVNDTAINYCNRSDDSFMIRCWNGEPPPSCKIVEEEVEIPEHIEPARKVIKRKLVCKDESSSSPATPVAHASAPSSKEQI